MSFDRIARPYQALERLTFGPLLTRAREHFLPHLATARNALLLGDGDGRFLYALLRGNPEVHALALDASPRMLSVLATRSHAFAPRFNTLQADLRQSLVLPAHAPFDLVVTHFLLDCLSTPEIHALLRTLKPHLAPHALWLVSDFRIPPRGPLRPLAHLLVRSLYLAFRLLTGLRIRRLPDHHLAFHQAGFSLRAQHLACGGILTAELWTLEQGHLHRTASGMMNK